MLSCFSHVQLFETLWTVTHQTPLTIEFSRQEYWNGLPCPPPGDVPSTGIKLESLNSLALTGVFFTTSTTWKTQCENAAAAKSLQSCPTLCNPMNCSLPGSSVHGILQARILEWVAVPSSRESFQPRDRTFISMPLASASRFFTTSATWE